MYPKSNDLYRGPTELVQHFVYRGRPHRSTGAAKHIIYMVWLYRSPRGREGEHFTCPNYFYLPSRHLKEGGKGSKRGEGESAPCDCASDPTP